MIEVLNRRLNLDRRQEIERIQVVVPAFVGRTQRVAILKDVLSLLFVSVGEVDMNQDFHFGTRGWPTLYIQAPIREINHPLNLYI